MVPYEPTASLVAQLQRLGYDASLRTFEGTGHTLTPPVQEAIEQLLDGALADRAGGGAAAHAEP